MTNPFLPASTLSQTRPGEWVVQFPKEDLPPLSIPSWIVEPHMEDRDLLLRFICSIYGHGRRQGKIEGRQEIRTKFKELMNDAP
jgi:hypothetical protein